MFSIHKHAGLPVNHYPLTFHLYGPYITLQLLFSLFANGNIRRLPGIKPSQSASEEHLLNDWHFSLMMVIVTKRLMYLSYAHNVVDGTQAGDLGRASFSLSLQCPLMQHRHQISCGKSKDMSDNVNAAVWLVTLWHGVVSILITVSSAFVLIITTRSFNSPSKMGTYTFVHAHAEDPERG